MILNNITLEQWLQNPPAEALKRGGDVFPFSAKYETFKHYLNNNLHKEVTKQAIYTEYITGKDPSKIIFLNDHGPEHIKTVIERASELLCNGCNLNVREVFLLLNAIQVHDVGNFYGRIGHESKVLDAINEGLTPIVFDITETRYIQSIAQAHGGVVKYKNLPDSKNTIGNIKPTVTSDGYTINQQFLAAILRFADELADDKYRADTKALNEGKLPKGSEVFHAYAACLDTVKVLHEKHTVELHFKVPKSFLNKKFGKIIKDDANPGEYLLDEVYLLDEIYARAIKMHTERIYCSKFWRKFIDIDKIWIQIEFYSDAKPGETMEEGDLNFHADITFTLQDNDYPSINNDIFLICPDLKYPSGEKINGENLLNKIS